MLIPLILKVVVNMIWSIETPTAVLTVKPGQVLTISAEGKTICIAAATADSRRLALVFDSRAGITFKGRKPVCRLITVEHHGGELLVKRFGKQFSLKVSISSKGRCCLCRMKFEGVATIRWCSKCTSSFHSDCIKGETKCPICRGAIH